MVEPIRIKASRSPTSHALGRGPGATPPFQTTLRVTHLTAGEAKFDETCHCCQRPTPTMPDLNECSYTINSCSGRTILKRAVEFALSRETNCVFGPSTAELAAVGTRSPRNSQRANKQPAIEANASSRTQPKAVPRYLSYSDGAGLSICGPWESFPWQVNHPRHSQANPFRLYTVAETTPLCLAGGGMRLCLTTTWQNRSQPKVNRPPAQVNQAPQAWSGFESRTKKHRCTMSFGTGSICHGKHRILSGKSRPTFHEALFPFAMQFPDVHLQARRPGEVSSRGNSMLVRADFLRLLISRFAWSSVIRPRDCPEKLPINGVPGARLDDPDVTSDLHRHPRQRLSTQPLSVAKDV